MFPLILLIIPEVLKNSGNLGFLVQCYEQFRIFKKRQNFMICMILGLTGRPVLEMAAILSNTIQITLNTLLQLTKGKKYVKKYIKTSKANQKCSPMSKFTGIILLSGKNI